MSWKNDPKIRDLEPYCKKHGYAYVVAFCVSDDHRQFAVTTYGRTKQLCKAAALAGDGLYKIVEREEWPEWPENEPPESDRDVMEARIQCLERVVEAATALIDSVDEENPAGYSSLLAKLGEEVDEYRQAGIGRQEGGRHDSKSEEGII